MEKLLRPERFDSDPGSPESSLEWTHWVATFDNFLTSVKDADETIKLRILINHVSHNVFKFIEDYTTYDAARKALEAFIPSLKTRYMPDKWYDADALIDTGSSESYVDKNFITSLHVNVLQVPDTYLWLQLHLSPK
ncbi:hypothetical protein FQR65_LT14490 [Abscondita terminalis]|nr:hypothetical protein FQR65_LT14490 [Abscondita terminalis]